jgi:hypothetical protein
MGGPLTLERAGGSRPGFLPNPNKIFRLARVHARGCRVKTPGGALQGKEESDG